MADSGGPALSDREDIVQPAYIVSAYKRPDLLFRLIDALGGAPVAVHVDKKSDVMPVVRDGASRRSNVTLLRRHVCHWGMFGHVRASLEGMAWFMGTQADYAILLTGQCYPLKTQAGIQAGLDGLGGRSILEHTAFPKPEWMRDDRGGYRRLDRFYLKLPIRGGPRAFKIGERRIPLGLHPYGGGSYWCLSRACVGYVLDFLSEHPSVKRFFRTTLIPDEMFFQTILANSPHRESLVDARIHHLDFSGGGANPATLTREDLPRVLASDAWFGRKFEDAAVLDAIDAALLARQSSPEPAGQQPDGETIVL